MAASERRTLLVMAVVVEGGALCVAVVLGYFFDQPFWETTRFSAGGIVLGLGCAVALTAVVLAMVKYPIRPLRQVRNDLALVVTLFKDLSIPELIAISALAGVGEEALFRGVMQPAVAGVTGQAPAILVVALVFGLLHAISVSYVVFAGVISVGLSLLYLWTENLAVPIIAHGAYDAFALIYATRSRIFVDATPGRESTTMNPNPQRNGDFDD